MCTLPKPDLTQNHALEIMQHKYALYFNQCTDTVAALSRQFWTQIWNISEDN